MSIAESVKIAICEDRTVGKVQIEPRVLKGFRDLLPALTIARQQMIRCIERVFASFGFVPIDTPALEYADILLGKGSDETDRQLYRFRDQGDRDIALRFDLTVPLARFSAMHINELGTPFRRYHIAPVWRAEKPQHGRFREFVQCDFDIIGTRSIFADAEIVTIIHEVFQALDISHCMRLNNRMILNGLLDTLGAREHSGAVLRAIDKQEKLGRDLVAEELQREAGLSTEQVDRVFRFLSLSSLQNGSAQLIVELRELFSGNVAALSGVDQLETIIAVLQESGVEERFFAIDLSIARGLDYYTGTVFETVLPELRGIGSVCSGGRYDNLASLYCSRELPGVGASVGLDRLLAAADELGRLSSNSSTADVLVTILDAGTEARLAGLAAEVRRHGVSVEVYPESAKLGAQLKYADRKGIRLAVIAGKGELEQGLCSVKELRSGEQVNDVTLAQLTSFLKQRME